MRNIFKRIVTASLAVTVAFGALPMSANATTQDRIEIVVNGRQLV
jgi:hypothetical protein